MLSPSDRAPDCRLPVKFGDASHNVLMGRPDDVRSSFDRAVDAYDEVRPSYPSDLFDALFRLLPPTPDVVEVGPGTGKATKDPLERGASVHAIEIGPTMATKLGANLGTDRLQITVGDFETIDLPAASADAVFAATSYHWIAGAARADRPAHILRSGGVLAIVDLIQVRSAADRGFFSAVQPIYERYGEGHTGPPSPKREDADPPFRAAVAPDERFSHLEVRRYDWDQTYTAAEYRKLMLSYSGTQMMHDQARRGLLDDIEGFINGEFDGQVTRPLVATLTTAVRR